MWEDLYLNKNVLVEIPERYNRRISFKGIVKAINNVFIYISIGKQHVVRLCLSDIVYIDEIENI